MLHQADIAMVQCHLTSIQNVRIPPYEKQNKVSNGAEDDAKVNRGGDPQSRLLERLKWRTKLPASGKSLENKV